MFRRSIAAFVLGPSLLLGSLAWAGFIALRTVFEPDRSGEIAEELLENEEVRAQLTENMGAAIEAALPDGAPVSGQVIDDAAATVLDNPEVEALILDAFTSTHAAFLGEGEAPETVDLTPIVASARETLGATVPGLEALLPEEQETFEVDLPTEHIPDASPVRRFLQRTVPYVAAIAVVGAALALLATTDRPSILRRAARWALSTCAIYLVVGLGIPWMLRAFAPAQAEVLAALLTAVLRSTLVPSIVLAVCGAGLLIAAFVWPDRGRTREAPLPASPRPVARPAPAAPVPSPPPQAAPPAAAVPARGPVPPEAVASVEPPAVSPRRPASTGLPPRPAPGDLAPAAPTRAPFPTREGQAAGPRVAADDESDRWLPPRWVEGHGWVLDPDDPKPPPPNARWVEGVGFVVPGPRPGT